LEVDVKEECTDEAGGHVVIKTWEARWTVQTFDQLPDWLKDNEYLLTGHRPPLPSVSECFKSIWSLHTETGNIWTHLIGKHVYCLKKLTAFPSRLRGILLSRSVFPDTAGQSYWFPRETGVLFFLSRCDSMLGAFFRLSYAGMSFSRGSTLVLQVRMIQNFVN
jgi:hypothetical protein